jgi:predicted outer membrane repeat protein
MRELTRCFVFFMILVLAAVPTIASAKVIYVLKSASGLATGTSWADAYTNLHPALAEALPGDQIWVASGTYHPGLPGDTDATYALPSGVALYGGFVGTESQLSERNWNANPTILSGDVGDDDVFGAPWWNGWNIHTSNSKHVVTAIGAAEGTLMDGVEVRQGYAIQTSGGGLYAEGSQLEIRNCKFARNGGYQGYGSSVFFLDGFLKVFDSEFIESWGRFVNGVGISTYGTAGAIVEGCTFYDNHAEADFSLGNGSGISFYGTGGSKVVNSQFRYNYANPFNIGYTSYGGGIHNFGGPLEVDRCLFEGNQAGNGGGIFSWKDLTVSNTLFRSNRVFSTNQGGGFGGAAATSFFGASTLKMTGCTIVNNQAHETGGVWYGGSGNYTTDISTCIFWGNSDINGIVSQSQVKKASSSCIQNLWVTIPGEDPIDPSKFPNCFDWDPRFVQFPTNLHLKLDSPCVDAGDKTRFAPTWGLDLDGLARFVDIPAVPDTGIGAAPLPDMGCYEAVSSLVSFPDGFTVTTGTLLSGGLPELGGSDDAWLRVRPSFVGSRLDPNVTMETLHPCPWPSPATLAFTLELSTTAGPNDVKLQAFNFQTQAWEDLVAGTSSATDTVYSGNVTSNAQRFVSGGHVKLRTWVKAQGANGARSWEARVDRVQAEITP